MQVVLKFEVRAAFASKVPFSVKVTTDGDEHDKDSPPVLRHVPPSAGFQWVSQSEEKEEFSFALPRGQHFLHVGVPGWSSMQFRQVQIVSGKASWDVSSVGWELFPVDIWALGVSCRHH